MTKFPDRQRSPENHILSYKSAKKGFYCAHFFIIGILKIKTATYFIYKAIKS